MDGQSARGHTYSNVVAQDRAHVHMGDLHKYGDASNHSHNYYFYSSSSQQLTRLLTSNGHGVGSGDGGLLSSKRGRQPDENHYKDTHNKEDSLQLVLSKFGKFSKSMQDQRIGKNAKKIARRIALVINAVKQQVGTERSDELDRSVVGHGEDDFETVDHCLLVAKRVDVNTGFRRTRCNKLTRIVRKYDRVASGQWEISLKTTTFEYRKEDGTEVIEWFSSLNLDPRCSDAGLPVTVHFGERTTHSAVSFINPVILAYRTISSDSEVFIMIKDDNVEGLVTLLADGKATVRDCDELGATLLHVCKHRVNH